MTNRLHLPDCAKVQNPPVPIKKWTGIDLFCGAGGTTIGVVESEVADIVAAINHDPIAIASHAANHPHTKHYKEDIVHFDVTQLPQKVDFIWMSAECIYFSNANGGRSRNADSRMLCEQIYRYATWCNPDYILVENVREFLKYSELEPKKDKLGNIILKNGEPVMVPKRDGNKLGPLYNKWVATLNSLGWVNHRYKLLNSADYGCYTARLRYFGIISKEGFPIRFPAATHHKKGLMGLPPWKAVKDVLNLEDCGKSIFNRKKPLAAKTLARIYSGLVKYVTNPDKNEPNLWNSGASQGPLFSHSINRDGQLVNEQNTESNSTSTKSCFLVKYNGTATTISINAPASTLTTTDRLAATFITKQAVGAGTTPGAGNYLRVNRSLKVDRTYFLDKQYSGLANHGSIEKPAGTLTVNPKLALIEAKSFILNDQYNNVGSSMFVPCPTLLASRRHHQVVSALFRSKASASPFVSDPTNGITNKIIEFMKQHGILDITMRMLRIPELKQIQGFPADYVLKGTQTDQKKFIGNSVVPHMSKRIVKTLFQACQELEAS